MITGVSASDFSGRPLSGAGDFNGDGYDDLLIAAYAADPYGNSAAGETYLIYGGPAVGTSGTFALSSLDGSNGFTMNGIDANDKSGYSVSSAGDYNNDGYGDILISAPYGDPNGTSNAGEVYLIYGGPNAIDTGGSFNMSSLDGSS
jgi:hypothetical protein